MKNPSDLYKQIGSLIRARRNDAGLTQEDLGERIHLTRTSINNFESGRQRIQIDTLYELAETLKVQPQELLPPTKERGRTRTATPKMLQGLTKEVREWVGEMSVASPQ